MLASYCYNMKTIIKHFALLSSFFLLSVAANAWNGRGHMLVGSIAYRNLSDSAQVHYTDMLKKHPFNNKWMTEFNELTGVELGEFLFMKASTWPDDIRKTDNPNDHPTWHYMSYKIAYDGKLPVKQPNDTVNVISQLEYCSAVLKNDSETMEQRAIALAWFIHLVGDIHQPLHTASLYNNDYPNGDLGGNSINVFVTQGGYPTNLHSFWDGLLGKGQDFSQILPQSRLLTTQHPVSTFDNADSLQFVNWSYESYALATTAAHRNGDIDKLNGITSKATALLIPDAEEYLKQSMVIGEKRVVLSGYRLAKCLAIN